MITPESPNALEEMLWMALFPRCHDPSVNNRLTVSSSHPAFEAFYRAHLGKLLLGRDALLHNTTAAAIVRIVVDDKATAVKAGSELAGGVMSQMQRLF